MLEALKLKVLDANLALKKNGLAKHGYGEASAIDRESGLVVIKPEGVPFEEMNFKDMMVVDLMGNVVDGVLHPSASTPTHIELYRAFEEIGSIAHVYSTYATAFAQAGRDVPFYGGLHAERFYGDVPCVDELTAEEIENDYERNVAYSVINVIEGVNPLENPAVLVKSDGAFTFGADAEDAVTVACELEEIAKTALMTELLNPEVERASDQLLDKRFFRRHGKKFK